MEELRTSNVHLIKGDCLEVMKNIKDKSIDMILCDLPYGTTACKWDVVIPFEPLWEQYNRIIKDNGAIVLFGSQPFTSKLINSNINNFRYEWIWHKEKSGNFMNCKFEPMKVHENILVFSKKKSIYNPIMEKRKEENKRNNKPRVNKSNIINQTFYTNTSKGNSDFKYPTSVKFFNSVRNGLHPTQKPLELLKYLIKTYTNDGETILDNCMGSGSAGQAVLEVGGDRKFIGIELNDNYFDIAYNRINGYIYE